MNKFEQLIEYVINDEDQKARELFHDIVVAKSREIYESMMADEAEEVEESEELDEEAEEIEEALEEDDPMADIEEEEISMEGEEEGGDAADSFIDNVEAGDDDSEEEGEEPATKDDVLNLSDKLDQLMAEFEAAMGGAEMGSNGDDMPADEGGDAIAVDDTEEMMPMAEAITLKQVHPKTTTSEEGDGKAGPVAFNAGARGMASKPVKVTGGDSAEGPHDTAAYRNATKDLVGKVGNSPAQGTQTLKPATKPHLGQASGVNNTSPLPRGSKG
jgi:hypothetical protein